jgi:HEAT repeat protein
MSRDNEFDREDLDGIEPDDASGSDLEHIRVFSIADGEDDDDAELERETAEAHPDKPVLATVLADLEAGRRVYADLYGLSDLTADDLALLAARWPLIDAGIRESVVREAFDIGVEDYRMHFTRLFLFATGDSEPGVRQGAVTALQTEEDPDVATRLLDILRDDPSDDVRSEAAHSLGPFVMLAEWEELPSDLSERLATSLFQVAEDETGSWHVRRRAAESAAAFGPSQRVNSLVQRLYDEDEMGLRASALYAAGRGNQRDWLPVAIEEFENEDAEIRFEAARASGLFGDVDALPGLSELARLEEDVDVRHAAITAIGEIGGQGAIRILMRLADSAPAADTDVIDDALVEASLETDPLSFDIDPRTRDQ